MRYDESAEIRSIYAGMKDRRIKFYKKIIKEFDKHDEASMETEKLLAYHLVLRNIRTDSEEFKKKVLKEIEELQNEDGVIN